MLKKISITADDYGPSSFINDGIIEAVKLHKVDSVGVLVNDYGNNYDFSYELKKLINAIGDKNIGIGVHLSITSGSPLVPSKYLLLENGKFQNLKSFNFGTSKQHLQAIKNELKAQINKLKDELAKYDKKIDHISSHHGFISLFTPYNDVLVDILKNDSGLNTCVRNPIPISKQKGFKSRFKNSLMKLKGLIIALRLIDDNTRYFDVLCESVKGKSMRKKIKKLRETRNIVPNHFFDNYYGKPSKHELNKVFKNFHKKGFRNRGEMVVHLGKGSLNTIESIHGIDSNYFLVRKKELKVLSEYDFNKVLDATVLKVPMNFRD